MQARSDQSRIVQLEAELEALKTKARQIAQNKLLDPEVRTRRFLMYFEKIKEKETELEKAQNITKAYQCYRMGENYFSNSQYNQALSCYQKALAIYQGVFREGSEDEARMLGSMSNVYLAQSRYDEALCCCEKSLVMIRHIHGNESETEAAILINKASVFLNQGQYEEASEIYQSVLRLLWRLDSTGSENEANALHNLAESYTFQNRYAEALVHYKQALNMYRSIYGDGSEGEARTLRSVADVYCFQGQNQEALRLLERALVIICRARGRGSEDEAKTLNSIAKVYMAQNRYEEALSYIVQSLEIKRGIYGEESHDYAKTLYSMANMCSENSCYDEALDFYGRSLTIQRGIHCDGSEDEAGILNDMANVYLKQSRFDEAINYHEQSLVINHKLYEEGSEGEANALHGLARVYSNQFRYEEALRIYTQALKMYRRVFGQGSSREMGTLNNMALVYDNLGRYDEALVLYEQALAVCRRIHEKETITEAVLLHGIAGVYKAKSRYEEALQLYEKSLVFIKSIHGKNWEIEANTLQGIAHVYTYQGRFEEALSFLEQAITIVQHYHGEASESEANKLFDKSNVYSFLNRKVESLACLENALKIFRQIHDGGSDGEAKTLCNIAQDFKSQGHYGKAFKWYQQAIDIFQTVFNDQGNPERCHAEWCSSRVALSYGLRSSILNAPDWYRRAQQSFQSLVAIHDDLISVEDLPHVYDITKLGALILSYATCLVGLKMPDAAWQLLQERSLRYQEAYPVIAYLLNQHAKSPVYALGRLENLAQQYQCQADFYAQQSQMYQAIIYMTKAQQCHEVDERSSVLTQWSNTPSALLHLESDIAAQYHVALRLFHTIKLSLFHDVDAENRDKLSGAMQISHRSKDLTGMLMVLLRNLLDQSYLRLDRAYSDHVQRQGFGGEHYFPLAGSILAFRNTLKDRQMVMDKAFDQATLMEAFEDMFAFNRGQIVRALKGLQLTLSQDNNEYYLAELTDDQLRQTDIPELFWPLVRDILLTMRVNHNRINQFLGNGLGGLALPDRAEILQALVDAGLLEVVNNDSDIIKRTYQFTASASGERADWPNLASLQPWSDIINTLLHNWKLSRDAQASQCFDHVCPDSYQALIEEQGFHYYNPDQNQADPAHWQGAWLEVMNVINNDAKHIRITPQGISDDLAKKEGLIQYKNTKILIDYLDYGRFYYWSFFPFIQHHVPDSAQAIRLSADIRHQLQAANIIDQNLVNMHDDLLQSIILVTKQIQATEDEVALETYRERDHLKDAFREKIKTCLPDEVKESFISIADFILRRALAQAHCEMSADSQENLEELLDRCMKGTKRLTETFAADVKRLQGSPEEKLGERATVIKPPFLRRMRDASLEELYEQKDHYVSLIHETTVSRSELHQLHEWLKALTIKGLQSQSRARQLEVKAVYIAVINQLYETMPWLGRHYKQKLERYNIYNQVKIDGQEALKDEKELYPSLADGVDQSLQEQYQAAYDLYGDICYLGFKLSYYFDVADESLKPAYQQKYQELQVKIGLFMIKTRHLLDLAMGQFAREHVYDPLGTTQRSLSFPCADSLPYFEDTLKKVVSQSRVKTNEVALWNDERGVKEEKGLPDEPEFQPGYYSISHERYDDLRDSIAQTQPYGYYDSEDLDRQNQCWLMKLRDISNRIKHVGTRWQSQEDIEQWYQHHTQATDVFGFDYIPSQYYPGDFAINIQTQLQTAGKTEAQIQEVISQEAMTRLSNIWVRRSKQAPRSAIKQAAWNQDQSELKRLITQHYDSLNMTLDEDVLDHITQVLLDLGRQEQGGYTREQINFESFGREVLAGMKPVLEAFGRVDIPEHPLIRLASIRNLSS